MFKVRAFAAVRCYFRDKTLMESGRKLRAPPHSQLYMPPRSHADLPFTSDTLPTGRLRLHSNGECQRSLETELRLFPPRAPPDCEIQQSYKKLRLLCFERAALSREVQKHFSERGLQGTVPDNSM